MLSQHKEESRCLVLGMQTFCMKGMISSAVHPGVFQESKSSRWALVYLKC